jgi:hypothetical protein
MGLASTVIERRYIYKCLYGLQTNLTFLDSFSLHSTNRDRYRDYILQSSTAVKRKRSSVVQRVQVLVNLPSPPFKRLHLFLIHFRTFLVHISTSAACFPVSSIRPLRPHDKRRVSSSRLFQTCSYS